MITSSNFITVNLIKLRNGLVHNKSDYELHETQIIDDNDGKRHLVPYDSKRPNE